MRRLLVALALAAAASQASAAARITIVNINAPGVGFNDPTPVAPVGGNTGTTFGQQALNAFRFAADTWGAQLDSAIEIEIAASFEPLTCTATSATLGSAGAIQIIRDFGGAEHAGTWYHVALANKLARQDLIPPVSGSILGSDIRARFNSELGKPGCLTGNGWYFGLDTGHAANQINLVTVLLHEFAHGLGFSSFANVSTGALAAGLPDVYSVDYFDDTTGKFRLAMTDTERRLSAINPRNVVWTGPKVTSLVPSILAAGTPILHVNSPAAADYQVGPAAFGPQLAAPGVTGDVVVGLDAQNASGPSAFDACTALTNAGAVSGKIALVDRGTCGFVVKVKNAQNAGAIAVIVADNAAGGPPAGLGGADPTITIPSVRITLADGNAMKAALAAGAVNVTLGVDPSLRAGADRAGRALLYTPNPVQPGSTVSHWDTIATPNQLMEPAINGDLRIAVGAPYDLTRAQLRDVGWYPDGDFDGVADDAGDQCLGSDLRSTIIVGGIDTKVANTFFSNGCSIRDLIQRCDADALNHGDYVSCSANLANQLAAQGFITVQQKGAIQSAVARDN